MSTKKQFIANFKKDLHLDFRSQVFLSNQYGAYPQYGYDVAKNVVSELNERLIDLFNEQYVIYNNDMDIESLRTQRLSEYINNRVNDYFQLSAMNAI